MSTHERILEYIPEYGRWDDMICDRKHINVYSDKVIEIISLQLNKDLMSETPSLLAKWLPSENASSKITRENATILIDRFGMTPKQYMKILSKLRKKIIYRN